MRYATVACSVDCHDEEDQWGFSVYIGAWYRFLVVRGIDFNLMTAGVWTGFSKAFMLFLRSSSILVNRFSYHNFVAELQAIAESHSGKVLG